MLNRLKIALKRRLGLSFYVCQSPFLEGDVCIGENSFVGKGTILSGKIQIGPNSSIGKACLLQGNIRIGKNTKIGSGTRIYTNTTGKTQQVTIGNYVNIGRGSTLEGRGAISIGHGVLISWNVSIVSGSHNYSKELLVPVNPPVNDSGLGVSPNDFIEGEIRLGNGIWVGCNSTIIMGAVIPDGCIVGANSLVSRRLDVLPWSIIAGNPAKKINDRFSKEKIRSLTQSPPWTIYS